MEPFEWLLLLGGLAVGSLIGSQGKGLLRSAARGYLAVEEKTKQLTANMREDFHDALEEARYERDHDAMLREEPYEEVILVEEAPYPQEAEAPAGRTGRRKAAQAAAPAERKTASGTRGRGASSTPRNTRKRATESATAVETGPAEAGANGNRENP
jgi:hypothetical protein